jgi:hypothetical protein
VLDGLCDTYAYPDWTAAAFGTDHPIRSLSLSYTGSNCDPSDQSAQYCNLQQVGGKKTFVTVTGDPRQYQLVRAVLHGDGALLGSFLVGRCEPFAENIDLRGVLLLRVQLFEPASIGNQIVSTVTFNLACSVGIALYDEFGSIRVDDFRLTNKVTGETCVQPASTTTPILRTTTTPTPVTTDVQQCDACSQADALAVNELCDICSSGDSTSSKTSKSSKSRKRARRSTSTKVKLYSVTFRWSGPRSALVVGGATAGAKVLNHGDSVTIAATSSSGTLSSTVPITVGGETVVGRKGSGFHSSCSVPIKIGDMLPTSSGFLQLTGFKTSTGQTERTFICAGSERTQLRHVTLRYSATKLTSAGTNQQGWPGSSGSAWGSTVPLGVALPDQVALVLQQSGSGGSTVSIRSGQSVVIEGVDGGPLPPELSFKVGSVGTVWIHTSCSSPVRLGDRFGPLEVRAHKTVEGVTQSRQTDPGCFAQGDVTSSITGEQDLLDAQARNRARANSATARAVAGVSAFMMVVVVSLVLAGYWYRTEYNKLAYDGRKVPNSRPKSEPSFDGGSRPIKGTS